MILKAFAIHDRKAGFFNPPFFFPSVGQAVRLCTDLTADMSNVIGRYPQDFDLYQVGEFDDATGQFQTPERVHICALSSLAPVPPEAMPSPMRRSGAARPNGGRDGEAAL